MSWNRYTYAIGDPVNGTDVGLYVAQFGSFPAQNIVMYPGYVSINGNIGGKVDKNGRLIKGTYTPCS